MFQLIHLSIKVDFFYLASEANETLLGLNMEVRDMCLYIHVMSIYWYFCVVI